MYISTFMEVGYYMDIYRGLFPPVSQYHRCVSLIGEVLFGLPTMGSTETEPNPSHPEEDLDDASSMRTVIGKPPNHWLHSPSPPTFDLTRPSPPDFAIPAPDSSIRLATTTSEVLVSPRLTALVIIDMQNFFLSTCIGRPSDGAGNKAGRHLLEIGIPAARKAGIRIIWLNWGLTDEDIDGMPPSTRRAFGFEKSPKTAKKTADAQIHDAHGVNLPAINQNGTVKSGVTDKQDLTESGKPMRIYKGLGSEIGPVELENGTTIDGGRLLMRDTWNAALPPALDESYQTGRTLDHHPDVWIHKNRMSGLWGSRTPCTDFLEEEGIKTLMFAGVNTDQCVGGSLQDAFTKGWDCILLSDACGTTSPAFAKECVEYNSARTWGFVSDCSRLAHGVESMLAARKPN